MLQQVLFGGNWDDGTNCRSRSANCNNCPANRNGNNGARGLSDTRSFAKPRGWHLGHGRRNAAKKYKGRSGASTVRECPTTIMKRIGDLYRQIIDKENIELAYQDAKKGKTWQRKVKRVGKRKEYYLDKLHEMLQTRTFRTSAYRTKKVYEPKERLIYILPFFPDRIVQHAIVNVLGPIWESCMIDDSYACRIGKGQHAGSKRCMQFTTKYHYALQCDISKFYPSIPHDRLKIILRKKIKCKDTLALLDEIIDSQEGGKGVPIGNYLSQWFGNLYLNELDHMIKEKYHIHGYLRYCDDFVLFANEKEKLNEMRPIIKQKCHEFGLRLSKMNLYPTKQGVDFLGYRHFHDGRLWVRKRTALRIRRRMRHVMPWLKDGKINPQRALSIVASANGWLKHANSHKLRLAMELDAIEKEVRSYQ